MKANILSFIDEARYWQDFVRTTDFGVHSCLMHILTWRTIKEETGNVYWYLQNTG